MTLLEACLSSHLETQDLEEFLGTKVADSMQLKRGLPPWDGPAQSSFIGPICVAVLGAVMVYPLQAWGCVGELWQQWGPHLQVELAVVVLDNTCSETGGRGALARRVHGNGGCLGGKLEELGLRCGGISKQQHVDVATSPCAIRQLLQARALQPHATAVAETAVIYTWKRPWCSSCWCMRLTSITKR